MDGLKSITEDLQKLKNPKKAEFLARYFKTGKGEYGEGDVFIGLTVPQVRTIAKKYRDLARKDIEKLLHNKIHEYRLTALLILNEQFRKADDEERKKIVDFYLRNTKYINNWDLVDLSSHETIGMYLVDRPDERKILYKLARSKNIWERRIAVVSTYAFLRNGDFRDTFAITEELLQDTHDLIHKAAGWMLREAGKRDEQKLVEFLKKYHSEMPRTMLRYAIEKFDEKDRRAFLHMR